MATKQVQVPVKKVRVGDTERKGKKLGGNKKTNQGKSKNTKYTTKTAVRERKGKS